MRSLVGCKFAHWNRKWPHVTGQKWTGQGVPSYLEETLSTNGGTRRSKHSGYYLWKEISRPCVSPVVAAQQDHSY